MTAKGSSVKLTKFSRFLITVLIVGGIYCGIRFSYPYFKDLIPPPTEVQEQQEVTPATKTVPVPKTSETKAPKNKVQQ